MADLEMKSIARQLEAQYPESNRGQSAAVISLSDAIVGDLRPILLLLLGGAGLLLLIATVNVANLLLVRAEGRRRELAVRAALGASATRLFVQFATEGWLLVAVATMLGVFSAQSLMGLVTKLIPADRLQAMPFLSGLGFNFRVAGFAILLALAAG